MKQFLKSYFRGLLVVLGIILLLPTFLIQEDTFISYKISALIILFSGVVIFLIIPDKRKTLVNAISIAGGSNLDNAFVKGGAFLFAVCGFGSIILYGFLASNYYLSQNENEEMFIVEIIRRGDLPGRGGCRQPFVEIEYKNIVKRLTFYCKEADDVKNAESLSIYVKEGLWGYEIITDKGFVGAFEDIE